MSIDGIARLLNRFSEAVDGRQPVLIAEQFAEDGVFAPGSPLLRGPSAIEAFFRDRQADPRRTTSHLWSNLRVDPRSEEEADFRVTLSVYAFEPQVSETDLQFRIGTVSGRCVRTDGDFWRFVEHRYQRTFTTAMPLTGGRP